MTNPLIGVDKEVKLYDTEEEATKVAEELTGSRYSPNVWYTYGGVWTG